jgi:hypothetical protein
MSNSPATSDWITAIVGEDDQSERYDAYGLLHEMLVYIQRGQPTKARETFARLRKMNLTDDEVVQMKNIVRLLPTYEQPVYTDSRAYASLFENTFGLNTDAMNCEQFKQFALGVIEGQYESMDADGRTYAVRLLSFLRREDLFSIEESGELLMKAIEETTERMQLVLPPVAIDDDQKLLLASMAVLGSQLRNKWFMAIVEVARLCIKNGYFDTEIGPATKAVGWRFGPVLPAAFDALLQMFQRDLDFWMRSQDMLHAWKVDLRRGNAASNVMKSVDQLLLLDLDSLEDLV